MKKLKKMLALALCLTFAFGMAQNAYACTGVIVGKDLTSDGSFIFGRTEDYERNRTKRLVVHPRGEFKKGEKLVDVNNGFEYIHPADSYKFFSTPDSSMKPKDMEQGVYDAAGYNEYGLGAFCTVSADYSDEIEKIDPYIDNGTNEASMTTVVLAHAKTAREGIELLAKLIDEKGASMGDIVAFGDKNEVWYMEIYSGHQYAAIKYPADKFSVFPNAFWLNGIDFNDKENVIVSKDIEKVAKEAGTYVTTEDGKMDLAASYNPKELRDSNRSRVWSGIHRLDPNSKVPYDAKEFKLLNDLTPGSSKIDIKDVLDMTRNRFENTDYKAVDKRRKIKDKNVEKYPIGNINTMQSHIFQIKKDFPKDAPGIMWLTLGSPLNTPYIPVFPDINDSTEEYKNNAIKYDPTSYYWVASAVNDLVTSDRDALGKKAREAVLKYEDSEMKNLPEKEKQWLELYSKGKEEAAKYATETTNGFSDEAFKLEEDLRDEFAKVSKTDIDGHWANKAILSDISANLMNGVDQLKFAPDNTITRAEFITILGRMAKVDEKQYTKQEAKDIEEGKFYTGYMNWAVEKGLIKGYKDETVKPGANLTREEMCVILDKYMEMTDKDMKRSSEELGYKDKDTISDWAKESVAQLSSMKLIKGKNNNNFAPKDLLTRAEVAQIIYNINNKDK